MDAKKGFTNGFRLPFPPQTPADELDIQVDVVSFTPAPPKMPLLIGDAYDLDTRDSSSTSSDVGTSISSGQNEMGISEKNLKHYYCQRCLNHKLQFPRKGHKPHCEYANCNCDACIMVEERRQLNNKLSQRKLDPSAPRHEPGKKKIRDPKCARCSAHNEKQALKGHKRSLCPFRDCPCELCKLVENRRKLMAKQIKLRRDQQKAWQAQQQVDDIEKYIRNSTNFDIRLPSDSKKFEKSSCLKKPRMKTSARVNMPLETSQLLRNTIEARQGAMNGITCEIDKNNENREDVSVSNMAIPMPMHPILPRQFKAHNGLLPIQFFPAFFPPPMFMPTISNATQNLVPFQASRMPVQKPTTVSSINNSSLTSSISPPTQQQINNSPPIVPLFNNMGMNSNEVASSNGAELSPLDKIQLLHHQFFDSLTQNSVKDSQIGSNNKETPDNNSPNKQFTPTTSNNFVIAPDILRQLNANRALPSNLMHNLQQQMFSTANQSFIPTSLNFEEMPETIPVSTTLLKHLFQLAASAKQN